MKAKSDLKTGVRDLGFGDEDENDIVNQLDSWMSLSQKTKALAALDYFDYKELGLKSYEDWVTLQVLISHTLVVENKLIEYRGIDEEKFELLQSICRRYYRACREVRLELHDKDSIENGTEISEEEYMLVLVEVVKSEKVASIVKEMIAFCEDVSDIDTYGTISINNANDHYHTEEYLKLTPYCK